MNKVICITFLVVVALASSSLSDQLSKDDYEVYVTVISHELSRKGNVDSGRTIVVRSLTFAEHLTTEEGILATIDSGGGLSKRSWQRMVAHEKDPRLLDSTIGEIVGTVTAGELAKSFHDHNIGGDTLRSMFTGLPNVILLDEELRHSMLARDTSNPRDGGFWDHFYRQFPNSMGTVEFSRVGFSQNRKYALVYVGYRSGLLAGHGQLVLLERQSNGWMIRKTDPLWIS